ncbi:MAG: hypothetical protein HC830_14095 [Bacteroidetes bacterium]|nr:hypothetical protein [Bacteroidota bacterium]
MWFGTEDGLNLFIRDSESFKVFKNIPSDKSSLSSNNINFIFNDQSGNLWIGTDNGLNLFDKGNNHFKKYGLDQQENKVGCFNGIAEDKNGIFWCATNEEIATFNPKTGKFKIIYSVNACY